jgi:15-hydroxyprostaglandin dehydrogenase (NAD)
MRRAASGMGLAVVEHLVREGWNVTVVDFNEESGKTVQKSLGSQVLFVHGNVISYENQAEAFVKTWEKWGRLDFGKHLPTLPLIASFSQNH